MAALLYWQSLLNQYVWDDWYQFINNPSLRIGEISWAKIASPILPGTTYFRPIVLLSFALEFHVLGVNHTISHAINIGLYLGIVALLFAIAEDCFRSRQFPNPSSRAALSALIYAAHPALVESVAWASGRFDLFATFFFLLAIFSDLRAPAGISRSLAVGLSSMLALGSKETGLMLPLALFAVRLATYPPPYFGLRPMIRTVLVEHRNTWLVLVATTTAYLGLRWLSLQQLYHVNESLLALTADPLSHLLLCLRTWVFYLRMVVVPFTDLGVMHLIPDDLFAPRELAVAIFGAIALIVLLTAAIRQSTWALFGLAGFFGLAPVLHIIPLTIGHNLGQERFLVLPMCFAAMAVASLPSANTQESSGRHRWQRPAAIALASWLVMSMVATYSTVPMWRNELSLWQWSYTKHPESDFVSYGFIGAALLYGRNDLADPVLNRMLAKGPLDRNFSILYGDYLSKSNHPREGIQYLENGIAGYAPLHLTADAAQRFPSQLAVLRPAAAYAYTALAQARFSLGEFEKAQKAAETALWYEPNRPQTHVMLGAVLEGLHESSRAQAAFAKAQELSAPEEKPRILAARNRFMAQLCAQPHATDAYAACRAPAPTGPAPTRQKAQAVGPVKRGPA